MLSANSQAKMYFVFLCYNYVCVVGSILTCFTFAVLLPCFAFVGFIDWFVSLLLFLKLEFGLEFCKYVFLFWRVILFLFVNAFL